MRTTRRRERPRRTRGDAGQTTVLIVGFATVVLLLIAVVIDSSAAYVQRQGLDTLADGAALQGADQGATGAEVYRRGVREDADLRLSTGRARAAVEAYLRDVGAHSRYPGLRASVSVAGTEVTVRLSAPLDLPLEIPGSPGAASVGSTGTAVVDPD